MRIALIHYRLGWKGGLETRLHHYTHWLDEAGHEVVILYAKKAQETAPIFDQVETIQLPLPPVPKPLRRVFFARKTQKWLNQNRVELSLSLGRTLGQDMVLAAANHRGYLRAMGKSGRRLTDWAQDWCDLHAFTQTPLILAASEMMKDELVNLYQIEPSKIIVLPPPFSKRSTLLIRGQGQEASKQTWGMHPQRISCAFVSTSHKRKGLDILLEVFRQLDPARFELFVAGTPFSSKLPHVHSLGFVKQPAALYGAADLYLHPARYEPFGQVITEALAAGTPVWASHQVGASQLIHPSVGKIIPSLDPDDWLRALQTFSPAAYQIQPNYVDSFQLDLEHHMRRILALGLPT